MHDCFFVTYCLRLYVDRRGLIDYEDSPNRNHRTSENELLEKDRLTINQLCLNKSHDGEFLLCRVVGGSFQVNIHYTYAYRHQEFQFLFEPGKY